MDEVALDVLRRAARGERPALDRISQALDAEVTLPQLSTTEQVQLLLKLKPKKARAFLRALGEAPSIAILQELDPDVVEHLLDDEGRTRVAKILAQLDSAAAADFLADAPAPLVAAALAQHPDGDGIRAALQYKSGSAGAVMRRRLVAAPAEWTIGQLIEEIRRNSDQIDKLYAVYVIDTERRLVGYLKIRDLLLHQADMPIGSVARPDVVAVAAETDQEEVAELARNAHLAALPVVDKTGRLLGVIGTEELRDIDRAEADEDAKLMAGLDPDASASDGPVAICRRRLPWLAAGLVGASTAALVVGSFEDALTEAAILASLIPIVMSLAGNAGIQASTVTVQAISAGQFWFGDLPGRALREVGGALLNGGTVGMIVAVGILLLSSFIEIERAPALGLTAFLTLIAVTVQASAIGSLVPLILQRLRFDPAVATGVFITTSNDVIGVLVFFLLATALYV